MDPARRIAALAAVSCVAVLLSAGCDREDDATDAGAGDAGTDAASDTGPFTPDHVCPGDPDCPDTGDGELFAAAVARPITPDWGWETWTDTEGDAEWDGDPFDDANGNGVFDAVWIAGYGNGRAANGVLDDVWARTVVLRHNETTVAITALDIVGLFYDETEIIRGMLPTSLGIDLVLIASTHDHEAPDTLGIWGEEINRSGVDPRFLEKIRAAVVANITAAVAALEPADVTYATTVTEHPTRSYEPYVSDSRHPTVLDPTLTMLRFTRESDGSTIGTIVNWAAHPEYLGSDNLLISSDVAGFLRDYITDGIDDAYTAAAGGPIPGIGGITVFINGPIGGQIGPNRVVAITPDEAMEFSGASIEKTMYAARGVAEKALAALAAGAVTEDTAPIELRSKTLWVHVQNRGYHLFALLGVLVREFGNWAPGMPVDQNDLPTIHTEVVYLRIGRAEIITNPGELFPELWLGGYDSSLAGPWPLIEAGVENPPDLALAPAPPYLRDLMTADYRMCWGLTQDMLGYIMPEFEFLLHPYTPYILEAEGDHYEETNSIGPDAEAEIVGTMRNLLTWKPGAK